MHKKIIILVLFFLVLLLIGNTWAKNIREGLEKKTVVPLRQNVYKAEKNQDKDSQILVLKDKVIKLEKENATMRKQLGSIPKKSSLVPASVIYQSENQYILSYPYQTNKSLINHPVVLNDMYLGKVSRVGESMLVVSKPNNSGFIDKAISQNNTEGRLKGRFNTEVVFESDAGSYIKKGENIYLLDIEHGWRFLVGAVERIVEDKRLPYKQAIVKYELDVKPETVFVVL